MIRAARPFEARDLPELDDTIDMREAFNNLIVAVNGTPYAGDNANAIAYTLRWLRANPEQANVLLGRGNAS